MANVKIVRATYLVIDGTTYKLIDEDVPNWAKELLPDKTLKRKALPQMRQPPEKDWKNWKGFRTSFMTKPVA